MPIDTMKLLSVRVSQNHNLSNTKIILAKKSSDLHFPFFQTMESQCWKAKEIWYEKCREVSKPINMMCWSCVVRNPYSRNTIFYCKSITFWYHCLVQADAVPKCDTLEVEKQIEVISGFQQRDLVSSLQYSPTFSLSWRWWRSLASLKQSRCATRQRSSQLRRRFTR